jgi:hypothetical protein
MTLRFGCVSAVVILVFTSALSAPASAQRTQWTEVHGGFSGGSSTLDTGGEIGIARDWSDRWTSYGFGATWVAGETSSPKQQMWGMVLNSSMRLQLPREKLRPYVEAGFNVYFIGYENIDQDDRRRSFTNPGLSLGAGAIWRVRPDLDVRFGAVAHFAEVDIGGDGEDWLTGLVGISFR